MYAVTISRDYEFAAAHRLENHPKCGRLHGHNYKVTVLLTAAVKDDGMVLDYAKLDRLVKPILDELDHRYMVSETNRLADDPYMIPAIERGDAVILQVRATTAECLCMWLCEQVAAAFEIQGIEEFKIGVRIWETSKSCAEYERETWHTPPGSLTAKAQSIPLQPAVVTSG